MSIGTAKIVLSGTLAGRRIFPAFDLRQCETMRDDLLLGEAERNAVSLLRQSDVLDDTPAVLDMMRQTKDNAEFAARAGEFVQGRANV